MSSPVPEKPLSRRPHRERMTDNEIRTELLLLRAALVKRELEELKSPILDSQDFGRRLGQMKHAYKQARFDSDLRTATKYLYDYLRKAPREETREYWQARTLLYELNDIFNITQEISDTALNDGQRIFDELRFQSVSWIKAERPMIADRKLLREKVLFCACRGNELKRRGDVHLALNLFEWLIEFTTNKLKTDSLPCYGTRAALSYHAGSTHRTLEQHRQAESMYSQALDLLYARGIGHGEESPWEKNYLTRNQAMVVGLGFGWTNLTRGFLARAENALSTARSMLVFVNDPVVSSYVDLLYATIKRCRAGTDKDKLNEAIVQLQRTRRAFMNHPRYQARTCWELALAKVLLCDFIGAQNDLRVVASFAQQTSNRKWQVNVKILASRIDRKQGKLEEARALADTAVEMAKSADCKTILPLVDAFITRGEAYISLAQASDVSAPIYEKARADFNQALQTMLAQKGGAGKADYFSNPKIASVCVLRIAQCYARMGNQVAAKKHHTIWLRLEPHVEHEWIRELAARIKVEIDKLSMDFNISAFQPEHWHYTESVAKLRRWLLTQALRQTNRNYSEAARLIGVQRATLYQWQTQDDLKKETRARTQKAGR